VLVLLRFGLHHLNYCSLRMFLPFSSYSAVCMNSRLGTLLALMLSRSINIPFLTFYLSSCDVDTLPPFFFVCSNICSQNMHTLIQVLLNGVVPVFLGSTWFPLFWASAPFHCLFWDWERVVVTELQKFWFHCRWPEESPLLVVILWTGPRLIFWALNFFEWHVGSDIAE